MPTTQVTIELECSFAKPSARDIEDREATIDGVYLPVENGRVDKNGNRIFNVLNLKSASLFDGCDMRDPQIQRVLINLNEAFSEEVREACEAEEG